MVISIARQSVIIKCNQQTSVLLGNYEFYYVSGLMKKLFNLDLTEKMNPQEMLEQIQAQMGTVQPQNEKEAYLIKLVSVFKPLEEYNEEMRRLFFWGAAEEYLWQVTTPVSK